MDLHLPEVTHFWASVPWMLLLGKCSLDAPLGSAYRVYNPSRVLDFDVAKSIGKFNSTTCHCIMLQYFFSIIRKEKSMGSGNLLGIPICTGLPRLFGVFRLGLVILVSQSYF